MSFSLLKHSLLMVGVLLSLSTQTSFAKEYYKWVDAKGSTHYTTTPPPKSAKKKGKIDTYGVTTSSSASQTAPLNNTAKETNNSNTTVVTADKVIVVPNEGASTQIPANNAEQAAE